MSYGAPNYQTFENNKYNLKLPTNYQNNYPNYLQMNKSIPYIPKTNNTGQHGYGVDLSISYKNYEVDEDYKKLHRQMYGNDLLSQMHEKERKKEEEKRRKMLEDQKEDERIKKEKEFLDAKARIEEMKRLEELERYKKDNQRIMNSYVVMSKPKSVVKEPEKVEDDDDKKERLRIELENQRKLELETYNDHIQNNLEKIRNGLINQQNTIMNKLNDIKNENLHANLYKLDMHKSVQDLRHELKQKRFQENFQQDYLYQSIVDSNTKKNKYNQNLLNFDNSIYLNRSLNILNLRDEKNINLDNKYYINANIYTDKLNHDYYMDKKLLNKIIIKNVKQLDRLKRVEINEE